MDRNQYLPTTVRNGTLKFMLEIATNIFAVCSAGRVHSIVYKLSSDYLNVVVITKKSLVRPLHQD